MAGSKLAIKAEECEISLFSSYTHVLAGNLLDKNDFIIEIVKKFDLPKEIKPIEKQGKEAPKE